MNNDFLHETYSTLCRMGLVTSGNDFSRRMLGRSARLYSWIKATNHPPALDVLLGLYVCLDDLHDEAHAKGDTMAARTLDDLAVRLWTMIREESLTRGPNRRKKASQLAG